MANPFEDEYGEFFVLVNAEGQYSLWPVHIPVPAGWDVAAGPSDRAACLEHVAENWTDMRPQSLVRTMEA